MSTLVLHTVLRLRKLALRGGKQPTGPVAPPGFVLLLGADGAQLTGADGAPLYGVA
jgi:hypothetical protein